MEDRSNGSANNQHYHKAGSFINNDENSAKILEEGSSNGIDDD